MKDIIFFYSGEKYDLKREKVITNIIQIIKQHLELPKIIEVQFIKLHNSVYGETSVDYRYRNRIKINESLSAKATIIPTIHELIHINQIYTGRLSGRKDGSYLWEGKVYPPIKEINHALWKNLPWELDVVDRQPKLLETVLTIGLSQN